MDWYWFDTTPPPPVVPVPTEEERAAAYRASASRRLAAERSRAALLAGSAPAALEVHDGWQPVIEYLAQVERDRGSQRDCGDD